MTITKTNRVPGLQCEDAVRADALKENPSCPREIATGNRHRRIITSKFVVWMLSGQNYVAN